MVEGVFDMLTSILSIQMRRREAESFGKTVRLIQFHSVPRVRSRTV